LIRPTHVGGKLDELLEGGEIVFSHVGPPGSPGRHARLDPGNVGEFAWGGEVEHQVALNEITRLTADDERSPRGMVGRLGLNQAFLNLADRRRRHAYRCRICCRWPARRPSPRRYRR